MNWKRCERMDLFCFRWHVPIVLVAQPVQTLYFKLQAETARDRGTCSVLKRMDEAVFNAGIDCSDYTNATVEQNFESARKPGSSGFQYGKEISSTEYAILALWVRLHLFSWQLQLCSVCETKYRTNRWAKEKNFWNWARRMTFIRFKWWRKFKDVSFLSFEGNEVSFSESRVEATRNVSAKLMEAHLRLFEHDFASDVCYWFT